MLELGAPGERGILVPGFDGGGGVESLPPELRRAEPPALPELGQPQVLRHFTRLSQISLGHNVALDMTAATTTPKYPPVVNELVTRSPKLAELHPDQPDGTLQGILRLVCELGECLKALSGMDACSLQGFGGAHAIFGGVLVIRAYHAGRGEAHRDEIISEFASHPTNPSTAAAAGFKVVEVAPGPKGYAEVEAVKAAVSERTAGLLLNNPEDTGVFNPEIDRLAEVVHEAGGLCGFDQANANATLGISRARDCGFDLAHFNLHKTFGAPISLYGPAVGALCVTEELARFLPVPVIAREGEAYRRDFERPESVGRLAGFLGNVPSLVKAYAWIRAIGPERIADVARYAVLNNNYVHGRLGRVPGITTALPENEDRRLDVVRYSLEELKDGDRRRHRGRPRPHHRLRPAGPLDEPSPGDDARAVHARADRELRPPRARRGDRHLYARGRGGAKRSRARPDGTAPTARSRGCAPIWSIQMRRPPPPGGCCTGRRAGHRSDTLRTVVEIRIASVDRPLADQPEAARLGLVLLARAQLMGLLPEGFGEQTRLSLKVLGDVSDELSRHGIARSASVRLASRPDRQEVLLALREMLAAIDDSPNPDGEWGPARELLGDELLGRLVSVSAASLRRYASGERRTPDDVAWRLHAVARILSGLVGSYNDYGVRRWFDRPRAALDRATPSEVIRSAASEDDPALGRAIALADDLVGSGAAT